MGGEVGADGAVGSGAVPIKGNSTRPQFAAECRTLEDILTAEGLQRPKTIDYMSVDAEAAEVEIFRNFPFEKFDISVVSVKSRPNITTSLTRYFCQQAMQN